LKRPARAKSEKFGGAAWMRSLGFERIELVVKRETVPVARF
jgi:hypothetical protein